MARSQNRHKFKQLLDEVVHKPLEDIDWITTLKIRNMVKTGEVSPRYALSVLKHKLFSKNPVTAYHALEVLENLVDYSGPEFQEELTRKSNCKMLTKLVYSTRHKQVQLKLLDLIRFWAEDFGQKSKHKYIKKAKDILQRKGYAFPENKFNYVPVVEGIGRYLEGQEEEVLCDNRHTPATLNQVQISPSAPPSDNKTDYTRAKTEKEAANQAQIPPPLPPRNSKTDSNTRAKTENELEAEEREKFLKATKVAQSSAQSAIQSSSQSTSQSSNQPQHQSARNDTPETTAAQGFNSIEEVQNELTCGICCSYFEEATTLSCSHSFCYACISSWRQKNNDCPMCRKDIIGMAPCRALDNMVAAISRPTTTNDPGSSSALSQSPSSTDNVQNNASSAGSSRGKIQDDEQDCEDVEDEDLMDFDDDEWEDDEEEDD